MPTVTAFQPTATRVFSFNANLDGAPYVVRVPWLAFGQRWYIEIYDQNQDLIVNKALVSSPAPVAISSATWAYSVVTIETDGPHGFVIGDTVMLTISGITPAAYNGDVLAFITGPTEFTYPLAANPGAPGSINGGSAAEGYEISLTEGYFTSTLVYYEDSNVFEVTP